MFDAVCSREGVNQELLDSNWQLHHIKIGMSKRRISPLCVFKVQNEMPFKALHNVQHSEDTGRVDFSWFSKIYKRMEIWKEKICIARYMETLSQSGSKEIYFLRCHQLLSEMPDISTAVNQRCCVDTSEAALIYTNQWSALYSLLWPQINPSGENPCSLEGWACLWACVYQSRQLPEPQMKKTIPMKRRWVIEDHNCDYKV